MVDKKEYPKECGYCKNIISDTSEEKIHSCSEIKLMKQQINLLREIAEQTSYLENIYRMMKDAP